MATHLKCLLLLNTSAPVLQATWWPDVVTHMCHLVQCLLWDSPLDTGQLFPGWPGLGNLWVSGQFCRGLSLAGRAGTKELAGFTRETLARGCGPAPASVRGQSPFPCHPQGVAAAALDQVGSLLAAAFVGVSVTGEWERARRFWWLRCVMRDLRVLGVRKEKGMTVVIR